ncbi:MAG: nucleotidyl transferase AbiEii/AbiGii toxin family protein [Polyangiales bacterium]
MPGPLDAIVAVVRSLNAAQVDYAIVGGVAMNLHGLLRATEDLDLFIRADAANVARLRRALQQVWDDPDIDAITAEDLCGDYPVVRYGPPTGSLYLDIATRLGPVHSWAELETQMCMLEGVPVPVATPRALYRMKRATVRPIDAADARALCTAFASDIEASG